MKYNKCKVVYDYEIQGNYGQGWEYLTAEETYKKALIQLKCYNDNENYPHRIKKVRSE